MSQSPGSADPARPGGAGGAVPGASSWQPAEHGQSRQAAAPVATGADPGSAAHPQGSGQFPPGMQPRPPAGPSGYPDPGHYPVQGGHQPAPPAAPHDGAALPGPGRWTPPQFPPAKPSELPVEPREYHEFLRTPRMRWWRPIAAIAMGAVLFLLANVLAGLGAMLYDLAVGNTTLDNYATLTAFKATPAFFFANNVGLALCIPIAVLTQWACFGQRPRWMASVVGRWRWRWFGECVVWMLPAFVLGLVIDLIAGGMPPLEISATTGFMIAAVVLTTPLQAAGEEFLLRGLGQRAIGAWLPRTAGLVVSTAVTAGIFMYLHGAGDPWLNVFYLLFAATASILAWRTGGLEAAIAMHVVNNMVAMTFLPFTDFSDMFDREAGVGSPWILTHMVIMLGAAALVLWRAKLRGVVTMSAPGAPAVPSASAAPPPIPPQAYPPPPPWRHDGNQTGSW